MLETRAFCLVSVICHIKLVEVVAILTRKTLVKGKTAFVMGICSGDEECPVIESSVQVNQQPTNFRSVPSVNQELLDK